MTTKTEEKINKNTSEKTGSVAVIKSGNRQYFVAEGDLINIEKISDKKDSKVGDKIILDEVLLISNKNNDVGIQIGTPNLKSKVEGEIIEIGKSKKVSVIRYRAKSRYFKKNGHRQHFFKIKITKIV